MQVKEIKAGEKVDRISTAAVDFRQLSAFGITADVFNVSADYCTCPIVTADTPGTGKLRDFLELLVETVKPREVIFVAVIHAGLLRALTEVGIKSIDAPDSVPDDPDWFDNAMKEKYND